MGLLENKVAVITGGSRGFGLAIARAFVLEGAKVIIASRSEATVQAAVEGLQRLSGEAGGMACDVGDWQEVEALAKYAKSLFGTINIWVNNAGVSAPYGPTAHIPSEQFEMVLRTNINGVYNGSTIALRSFLTGPQLPELGDYKLINILGRGDTEPVPNQNAYASSKTWVRTFTKALASEYKAERVGIFAFNPGLMETDLMEQVTAVAGYEGRLQPLKVVMQLWGQPPEIPARKVVWLASAATDGQTGLEIKELNFGLLAGGAARAGWRWLRRRTPNTAPMKINTVPASLPVKDSNRG